MRGLLATTAARAPVRLSPSGMSCMHSPSSLDSQLRVFESRLRDTRFFHFAMTVLALLVTVSNLALVLERAGWLYMPSLYGSVVSIQTMTLSGMGYVPCPITSVLS
jgi:hypothetical protein